jgi:porphobilinogen synthase
MDPYVVPPASHLHSSYSHPLLRSWSSQHADAIPPAALVWPLFLLEDASAKQAIPSMPGQYRWGCARLGEALDGPVARGLRAVLLFGVLEGGGAAKDGAGSAADAPGAPVPAACAYLRARYPQLLVMVDLCLCGYTDHGHCGIVQGASGAIDNAASVARLAAISVAFARAGAQVIAPSDMMDGRVGAIKAALRAAGLGGATAVMAYSAKFASCFYGPFRDAAHSGMAFGDRACYQLPPASRSLALRALQRDVAEGADYVMVKPGGPYLDVCRDAAEACGVPVAAYQVSGEFAMLHHAAAAGAFDLQRAVMESMVAFRRAGVRGGKGRGSRQRLPPFLFSPASLTRPTPPPHLLPPSRSPSSSRTLRRRC